MIASLNSTFPLGPTSAHVIYCFLTRAQWPDRLSSPISGHVVLSRRNSSSDVCPWKISLLLRAPGEKRIVIHLTEVLNIGPAFAGLMFCYSLARPRE